MKYIIEMLMPGGEYKRSWSFHEEYGFHEAKALISDKCVGNYVFRVKPVSVPKVKKYRRHAAVTQLELRGAIVMLTDALLHAGATCDFNAWEILYDAKLAVIRQLEKL
jgi:hypothetical protein